MLGRALFTYSLIVALLVSSVNALAHETNFLHVDEYLSHGEAKSLDFSVEQKFWSNAHGGEWVELSVSYPREITGQPANQPFHIYPCKPEGASGSEITFNEKSKTWSSRLVVRDSCTKESMSIGVYGHEGSLHYYWLGFEQ